MRIEPEASPPGAVSALIARLRRRTGRVGAALALLAGTLAAAVVFTLLACKTMR